ncbi:UbiA family prenyltransferase [bacterium SCSIO 12696]|nr:UbiA family prenyltransferase [bacterium SCSIO 12696]
MSHPQTSAPIFVDMDGTLIKGDIALELAARSLKHLNRFAALLKALFKGRSDFKRYLADHYSFSAKYLPYNSEVVEYLKTQKALGRKVILATASDEAIAQQVANHLGIFDAVIASSPGKNLKGDAKLAKIQEMAGTGEFEYIGDSKADLPIWEAASYRGFVNPSANISQLTQDHSKTTVDVRNKPPLLKIICKAARPHQWAKNCLIFVPLIFSHQYLDIASVGLSVVAFFAFSFCASGIYIVNDLLDIESDRTHPEKKNRPFASGNLSIRAGAISSAILILSAFLACSLLLNTKTVIVLSVYFLITNLYSFYLKHYSTIDVISLTCLYTIRIVAGSTVIAAPLSPWLLNFSVFFFLSLAYMKRYIEVSSLSDQEKVNGRNYKKDEIDVIMTTGIVNGGLATLTLSLYLNSEYVVESYASPQILWLICPLLLFWIYRAWLWAKRGKISMDPVVFALKDKISLVSVLLAGIAVITAKLIPVSF